jgi:hypothetical protein
MVSFTTLPFYPRKNCPQYPLDRSLGAPQSRHGRCWEVLNSCPNRDSNSDPSVVQPVGSRYTDYATVVHNKRTDKMVILSDKKGKAIPVTGRGSSHCCEMSRLPHYLENHLTDGCEFFSLTNRPPFISQKYSWYLFL